jgi:protein tyrosine phosphatase
MDNSTGYQQILIFVLFLSGPKSNTMNAFWQMIWQERVEKIVMVTQLVEGKVVTFYYSL